MRILLDTNVLVRAAGGRGVAADRLLLRVLDGPHVLLTSEPLLAELQRALCYDRVRRIHRLNDSQIDQFVAHIRGLAFVVPIPDARTLPVVFADPDDDFVVAAAVLGRAAVLCTWDKHLTQPKVRQHLAEHGVRVLQEDELLREL